MLIQAGLGEPPIAPGGFLAQLPKDQITAAAPMAWCYHSITSEPSYTLVGQDGFTGWHVQIDCHGFTRSHAITLERAIDGVLRGIFRGVLPDPDSTFVEGIFRESAFVDGFSDVNQTFVRSADYLINYHQI